MAAQGRDIKLSIPRVEGYRNFATKLWNASRFAEMNGCARVEGFDPRERRATRSTAGSLGEAAAAVAEVAGGIEEYRFNDAANAAYRFIWSVLCDWCLELAKPVLQGEASEAAKAETRATIAHVLDVSYALLHPFMPFLTEELWAIKGAEGPARAGLLALAPWPEASAPAGDAAAEAEIGWVIELIEAIRSIRSEMAIAPNAPLRLALVAPSATVQGYLRRWRPTLERLARIEGVDVVAEPPRRVAGDPGPRRAGGAAARGPRRFRRRARPPRQGNRQGARRDRQGRRQACQPGFSGRARPRRSSRRIGSGAKPRSARIAKLEAARARLENL